MLMFQAGKLVEMPVRCQTCTNSVDGPWSFIDDLSMTEFSISGMCQECQDSVFEYGDEDKEVERNAAALAWMNTSTNS